MKDKIICIDQIKKNQLIVIRSKNNDFYQLAKFLKNITFSSKNGNIFHSNFLESEEKLPRLQVEERIAVDHWKNKTNVLKDLAVIFDLIFYHQD
jgi:hypothetical protein